MAPPEAAIIELFKSFLRKKITPELLTSDIISRFIFPIKVFVYCIHVLPLLEVSSSFIGNSALVGAKVSNAQLTQG
jgi:hypothetical protein